MCAAALFPGSNLIIEALGMNPTRAALLDVLTAIGARMSVINLEEHHGEIVGTLKVEHGTLRGTRISGAQSAQLMIGFFDNLAAKQGKAEALRNAQLALIKARRDKTAAASAVMLVLVILVIGTVIAITMSGPRRALRPALSIHSQSTSRLTRYWARYTSGSKTTERMPRWLRNTRLRLNT